MEEPAGKAHRDDPAHVPELVSRFCSSRSCPLTLKDDPYNSGRQVKLQLVSQLKRYFQPTILSFGMKYLPSVLHLVQFHVSDIRLSLKEHAVVLLLDSIDASFDVTYEAPPAFVTPETALSPETPMEPWSPIPGSFFPLPSVDEQDDVVEEPDDMNPDKVRTRGWNSLWRKVMGRASGQIDMTLVVSKCRVLQNMEEDQKSKRSKLEYGFDLAIDNADAQLLPSNRCSQPCRRLELHFEHCFRPPQIEIATYSKEVRSSACSDPLALSLSRRRQN